ncbi:MAG: hypothetical protein U9Q21_02595 [Candidatus Auribacterota bacterium]|nr:hypothetical protein [Candidatus Auribacterota bacterium]
MYPADLNVLVGKLETVPGTPETNLVAADLDVRIFEPTFTPGTVMNGDIKYATGDHSEHADIAGAQIAQLAGNIHLNDAGAAGTKPNLSKFLESAGLKYFQTVSKGVWWQPLKETDCNQTMTLWFVKVKCGPSPKAIAYKFGGAKANVVLSAGGVGQPWMAALAFQAFKAADPVEITDASTIAVLTGADTAVPHAFLNCDTTIGVKAITPASFSLDSGNEVLAKFNPAKASGVDQFYIATRKPRFSLNPLTEDVADYSPLADMDAETLRKITMVENAGISFSLTIAQAQVISAALAAREGLNAFDLNYKCLRNGETGSPAVAGLPVECPWEFMIGSKT